MNAPRQRWSATAVTAVATLLLAACATEPSAPDALDASGGLVEVAFAGDGFVHGAGERRPLDAGVLRMRQRLRTMDAAARASFVVQLRVRDGLAERAEALRAEAELNRTVDELHVMGVRQIRIL
ncbi:MAG: hypothetical protein ACK5UQ_08035 [Planctomycetota bacterium]